MLLYVSFVLRITNFFLVHNVIKGAVRDGSLPFTYMIKPKGGCFSNHPFGFQSSFYLFNHPFIFSIILSFFYDFEVFYDDFFFCNLSAEFLFFLFRFLRQANITLLAFRFIMFTKIGEQLA